MSTMLTPVPAAVSPQAQIDLLSGFSQALHMLMDTPIAYSTAPSRGHLGPASYEAVALAV